MRRFARHRTDHRIRLAAASAAILLAACGETLPGGPDVRQNDPPIPSIIAPADGTSALEGEDIVFRGAATDPEDGTLPPTNLLWMSDIDGELGSGGSVVAGLSAGEHTVTLEATDSDNASATAAITVRVESLPAPNTAPSVTITAPASGATFDEGDAVTFRAAGSDAEDGALGGASLAWSSSLDGPLGTGAAVTTSSLSVGTHTVTLTGTDSDGAENSSSITVTIDAAPSSSTQPIPLIDMGGVTYRGFEGGLYPGGGNSVPAAHRGPGISRAGAIDDTPVLVSIGMSNAEIFFADFISRVNADGGIDPNLTVVNAAQAGKEASDWTNAGSSAWEIARERVQAAGATQADVDAIWLLEANRNPTTSLPSGGADAYELLENLGDILRAAKLRFPNLRLAFVSSRIYSCATSGNSEPYAYESGFAVKWLVEAQIEQAATGSVDPIAGDLDYQSGAVPWVAWGPYVWANGSTPRSDGLAWLPSDFQSDCVHPSASGAAKVGTRLLSFFKGSGFTRPWFLP